MKAKTERIRHKMTPLLSTHAYFNPTQQNISWELAHRHHEMGSQSYRDTRRCHRNKLYFHQHKKLCQCIN